MPLPRLVDDQSAGVSDFLNATADEIDRLGSGCVVRRTGPRSLSNNVDTLLEWQLLEVDTSGGGMWTPLLSHLVSIRTAGTYSIVAQCRFGYLSTGSPYNNGHRGMRLLRNGTNPLLHTIAPDKKAASVDGEGVTLSLNVTTQLGIGDQLLLSMWQNSGGTIQFSHTDFGGTFLAAFYTGPS